MIILILEKLTPRYALIYDDDTALKVSPELVSGCREGDVLMRTGDMFIKDQEATAERRRNIQALQDSLWE